jgi:hypothetical protein
VDDGLDAVLGEGSIDEGAVGDGAEDVGVGARSDVEARDVVAFTSQPRRQEAAEPAGRACKEDSRVYLPPFGLSLSKPFISPCGSIGR